MQRPAFSRVLPWRGHGEEAGGASGSGASLEARRVLLDHGACLPCSHMRLPCRLHALVSAPRPGSLATCGRHLGAGAQGRSSARRGPIPLRTSSPSSATYELALTDVGRSRLLSIHTTRRRTPSEHAAWPHLRDRTHAGRRGARRVDQLLDQPLPLVVPIDRKETRAINFRRVLEAPGDGAHELAGPS